MTFDQLVRIGQDLTFGPAVPGVVTVQVRVYYPEVDGCAPAVPVKAKRTAVGARVVPVGEGEARVETCTWRLQAAGFAAGQRPSVKTLIQEPDNGPTWHVDEVDVRGLQGRYICRCTRVP